ncbi:MAG TPA: WD40 repeat domain-containing protein [Candidatus Angelobacter sp.]|jgi:WD40 repeat protein|nr:WD40 repeat domain-containing protein [Candidatus Angelobacter sp.]
MMIAKFAVVVCSALAFCSGFGVAQPAAQLIHLGDWSDQQFTASPENIVKLLFPRGEAILDQEPIPADWKASSMPLLRKIKLVKVSDTQGRFALGGVLYGKRIFLLDKLLCGENPVVMSRLMEATATAPKNPGEVLALAKFYLSLSQYRWQNVDQFVVSSIDEHQDSTSLPEKKTKELQPVLHAPRAISKGEGYEVELFSSASDKSDVHRWRMTINPAGLENVSDQIVFPNCENFRELYARAEKNPEKIELLNCCVLGNGRAEDGAMTGFGTLAASNGPRVGRVSYYYESAEKAEARFHRSIAGAVAVIDDGPWLDSDGQVAGKRATLIEANVDKILWAVQLIQEGSTVIEFSSYCLRNVLAVAVNPPRGNGTTGSLVATLDLPHQAKTVAFSPDGRRLAAGYGSNDEGGIRVWNVGDRSISYSWESPAEPLKPRTDGNILYAGTAQIKSLAFSPDGKWLGAATGNGDILVFDAVEWGQPRRITLNASSEMNVLPIALSFSPRSDLLALSTGEQVIVYDLKSEKATTLKMSEGFPQNFIAAGFLSDAKTLVICDRKTLLLWDLDAAKPRESFANPGGGFNFFCRVSPARNYVVTGGGAIAREKLVEVWKTNDFGPPAKISDLKGGVFTGAISHSEELVALGGGDYAPARGDIVLWKTGDPQEVGHISTAKSPIHDLAFSPDDRLLAAVSDDGVVFLYSVELIRNMKSASAP